MFGTYKDAKRIIKNLYLDTPVKSEQRILKLALLRLEIAENVLREEYEADGRDMRSIEFSDDDLIY